MVPDRDVAGVVGGLLVASGVLVATLGGLCTGLIVVPATAQFWTRQGFRTLGDLWPVLAGGTLTVTAGASMIRAGLRRLRD